MELGWEFDQTYAIDSSTSLSQYYWQIRFAPYVQVDAIIHPELYIDQLYVNQVTFDLNQFKTFLFAEIILF